MKLLRVSLFVVVIGAAAATWWWARPRSDFPPEPVAPIERLIDEGAKVLFVCAHPADVLFVAPLLARAGERGLVLSLGAESDALEAACRALGVRYQTAGFVTAAADPGEPRVLRKDLKNVVVTGWARQGRDPREPIRTAIASFRPDIVLTFDVDQGMTGDKEHRAVGELTMAAFTESDSPKHLYCVVNRFPKLLDPPPPTIPRSQLVEIVSARRRLADGGTGYDRALSALGFLRNTKEARLFTDDQWERLLRETALIVVAQR